MFEPPLSAIQLRPGVYLLTFPEPGDGLLVDRTRSDPAWVAVADVVVDPGPDDDLPRLICLAALAYRLRLRAAAVSRTSARPAGNA